MADWKKGEEAAQSGQDTDAEKEAAARRRLTRGLILGTLAASGAFQLNGWEAQAHGNRSSHATAALRSDLFLPQDYIAFRQELTAPTAEVTLVLSRLTSGLNQFSRLRANRAPELRNADTAPLRSVIAGLEQEMQLRPTSRDVLGFLNEGDIDAAAATIEGEGEPERVTYEYLWTITDLAYLGREGGQLTDANMSQLVAISRRAVDYCSNLEKSIAYGDLRPSEISLLTRVAEIYHNVGSYMTPDIGEPKEDGLELGYQAAISALALRERLEQPRETMIANWLVAVYEGRRGNAEESVRLHQLSTRQAEALGDVTGMAWNQWSMAQMRNEFSPAAVAGDRRAMSSIDELLSRADPNEPSTALLRLEIANARGG